MGSCLSLYDKREDRRRAQRQKEKDFRRAEQRERRARRRRSVQIRNSVREINEERRRQWQAHCEQKKLNAAIANSLR